MHFVAIFFTCLNFLSLNNLSKCYLRLNDVKICQQLFFYCLESPLNLHSSQFKRKYIIVDHFFNFLWYKNHFLKFTLNYEWKRINWIAFSNNLLLISSKNYDSILKKEYFPDSKADDCVYFKCDSLLILLHLLDLIRCCCSFRFFR